MKWFDVTYTETVNFRGAVEAESEADVRAEFEQGYTPAGEAIAWDNTQIVTIEEVE